MACGPIDFRRQQRERWIGVIKMAVPMTTGDARRVAEAIQADLRESQAQQGAELEKLRSAIQAHLDTFGYDNHEGLADALSGDPEIDDGTLNHAASDEWNAGVSGDPE